MEIPLWWKLWMKLWQRITPMFLGCNLLFPDYLFYTVYHLGKVSAQNWVQFPSGPPFFRVRLP